MSNKHLILLTASLVLCLLVGALFYRLAQRTFPCPIVSGNDSLMNQVRLSISYDNVVLGLTNAAERLEQNPSDWSRVEVIYINEIEQWMCGIYQPLPNWLKKASKDDGFWGDTGCTLIWLSNDGKVSIFFPRERPSSR